MRVGFVQFSPIFGDPPANVELMKQLIEQVEADLLVLPELATTGYAFTSTEEFQDIAEPFDMSPSLDILQDIATARSTGLVVGFAENADEGVYNSSAFLGPDGSRELYRKIHLFGSENLFFLPGDKPFEVFEFMGVSIGMMICFDWFFPESARELALKGAQVIAAPVNLVLPWGQRGMVIRSLENHVFIIAANRYGTEQRGPFTFTFTGESQITSPKGAILASAPKEGDSVAVVEINPEEALDKSLNRLNDLFQNRRPEFYTSLAQTGKKKTKSDDTTLQ